MIRLRRGMLGRVPLQRMDCIRVILWVIFLLWALQPGSAMHPRRRDGGRGIICRQGPVLIARTRARLYRLIGPSHAERIGLTDQPRQFSQRIALAPCRHVLVTAAIIVVISGERSVLISISHRDDASPSGKPANPPLITNQLLPDAPTGPHVSEIGRARVGKE